MATAKKKAGGGARKAPAKRPAAPRRRAALVEAVAVLQEQSTRRRARLDGPDLPLGEIGAAASKYFASQDKDGLEFVSSGCGIMDAALGGGWCNGRVVNLVGDKSSGKTLLAIEACANFRLLFPCPVKARKDAVSGFILNGDNLMRYAESEHAFDEAYAEALGMPIGTVEFVPKNKPLRTVEDFYHDAKDFIGRVKKTKSGRGLYVLDSLDALSDDAELAREMGDSSFGAGKAKAMHELFRRLVAEMDAANILLIVVSQLKEKIGVMFGEKKGRTGGTALDYYASHIVWLSEVKKLDQTIGGIKRIIGVRVRARVKKNKVGLPFRECEYPILFGYGVDDLTADVEWLLNDAKAGKDLKERVSMSEGGYQLRIKKLRDAGGQEVREVRAAVRGLVAEHWQRVETQFLPKSGKY